MNNKEFLGALSTQLNISNKEAERLVETLTDCLATSVDEETSVSIQGFGNFEVKKKLERVAVNPSTKKRYLVPPKLVLNFKPSPLLKDKAQ
ncbi:MAG: HU family DNA-binding protein [Bacteroidaceae bacterium]|nr:HU family DNA-binding protein [Bacteroidaceae bacterium]